MKILNVVMSFVLLGVFTQSCTKDSTEPDPNPTYPMRVKMTDAPGPYNAVFIDLQGVEITGNSGSPVMLNVNAGIYNLLDFSNGLDTLIATGTMNSASVQQIRLILGANNTVVVDNVSYPLSTPSADQSGLKLQVHQTLQAGVMYTVLLDFDANKSIVNTGNGSYKLKPVIRTIETAISGSIKGSITPIGILASVTATSATNETYSSSVNANGEFMLKGIPAGVYSVTITPQIPFLEVTVTNVLVTIGNTTLTGVIVL